MMEMGAFLQMDDEQSLDKVIPREVENKTVIKNDGTILIKNVYFFQASKNISYFVANLTFEDIAKSIDYITYDEQAQRRLKNGEPFLKDSQVKEFEKVLDRGEDIIGNLVWNLRTEDFNERNFNFDPDERTLTIDPKQTIYITDGYHRTKSCHNVYKERRLGLARYANFTVHIHFLDAKKERDRFGKINHNTNQLSHSKRKRVLDDLKSDFIRQLIDKTFLKTKIEDNIDNLSLDKLYTFNQLYNAIFGQKGTFKKFELEDEKRYNELLQFLTNFFNYLPKIRKEFLFENEEEKRNYLKKSLVLEPIMLYAYMTLAKEVMKKGDERLIDDFFEIKLYANGKPVWFFARNSSLWVGKILYNNGNSISGYPPQTSLIDTTINAIKMISN